MKWRDWIVESVSGAVEEKARAGMWGHCSEPYRPVAGLSVAASASSSE